MTGTAVIKSWDGSDKLAGTAALQEFTWASTDLYGTYVIGSKVHVWQVKY